MVERDRLQLGESLATASIAVGVKIQGFLKTWKIKILVAREVSLLEAQARSTPSLQELHPISSRCAFAR